MFGDNPGLGTLHNLKMYISNPNYRLMGCDTKIIDGMPHFYIQTEYKSIIDIIADLLRYIRHQTNQFFEEDIRHAVFAMPARFNEIQKQWIIEAAVRAGWSIIRIITEPTAGFLACHQQDCDSNRVEGHNNYNRVEGHNNNDDGIYGVYDLGGSTFDFSLINTQADITQVIATSGNLDIGMEHIYQEIFVRTEHIESVCTEHIESPDHQAINSIRQHFTDTGHLHAHHTSYITPIIQKTIDICMKVIQDGNVTPDKIRKILLIGGGAKISIIRDAFLKLGINAECTEHPQLMVAAGCAIYAKNLIDKKSCLLLDVAPLSLSIEIYNGMLETIIHKNSPLPITRSVNFTNIDPHQTHIILNICQGDSNYIADCHVIATLTIPIQPMPVNTHDIRVIFELDHNNVLNVHAIDMNSALKQSIQIDTKNGLTAEMVNRMRDKPHYIQNDMQLANSLARIDGILSRLHPKYASEFLQARHDVQNNEEAKELLLRLESARYDVDWNGLIKSAQKLYDNKKKDDK
jgi:molecular chaperone HscA